MRELLPRPIEYDQLTSAFKRVAQTTAKDSNRGHFISVIGTVGGSGSTTIATNLACELACLQKDSTALVDLDVTSGDIPILLDISPQFGLSDLCHGSDQIDWEMIERAVVKHRTGLCVLTDPAKAVDVPDITIESVAAVVNILTNRFQYVICDGISRNEASHRDFLQMTDTILLVVQLVINSIHNARRFLHKLKAKGFDPDRVKLIANRCGGGPGLICKEDAEETLEQKILWTISSDWEHVSQAASVGQPLCLSSPNSMVRKSIRDIALQIHAMGKDNACDQEQKDREAKAGFFKRILRIPS